MQSGAFLCVPLHSEAGLHGQGHSSVQIKIGGPAQRHGSAGQRLAENAGNGGASAAKPSPESGRPDEQSSKTRTSRHASKRGSPSLARSGRLSSSCQISISISPPAMKFRGVLKSITKAGPMPATNLPASLRDACVCVVGVGYVGESLLSQFGSVVNAIGYDVSTDRIAALQPKYQHSARIRLTTSVADLAKGTHFFIAVPTPLRDDHSVNLDCVQAALDSIVAHAQAGSCVIIESSVPVGTTRKLLGPHKSTFHCGMSPERIDPGRLSPSAEQIPKVISALTPRAMKHIFAIYAMVYETLVPVSKPEVAEMTKLYENCYRMVNIAYVNEISDACLSHGIDPSEMIGAAATKPFGFQPFYPGLGVGGHCIPINPYYLFDNNPRLKVLQTATKLMQDRPRKQARRFHASCRAPTRPLVDKDQDMGAALPPPPPPPPPPQEQHTAPTPAPNPRILVVGLGFKPGQTNLAGSPAVAFARQLHTLGSGRLAFYDPTVAAERVAWMEKLQPPCFTPGYLVAHFDGVVLCNKVDAIDTAVLDALPRGFLVKSYV